MSSSTIVALLAICLTAVQFAHAQPRMCVGKDEAKTFTDGICPQGTQEAKGRKSASDARTPPPRTLEQQRAEVIKSWDRQIEAKVKEGKVPLASLGGVELPPRLPQSLRIPRSAPGDKGVYALLGVRVTGPTIVALHSRSGPSGTGYSLTETNCRTRQMLEHGYTEEPPERMTMSPASYAPATDSCGRSTPFALRPSLMAKGTRG